MYMPKLWDNGFTDACRLTECHGEKSSGTLGNVPASHRFSCSGVYTGRIYPYQMSFTRLG